NDPLRNQVVHLYTASTEELNEQYGFTPTTLRDAESSLTGYSVEPHDPSAPKSSAYRRFISERVIPRDDPALYGTIGGALEERNRRRVPLGHHPDWVHKLKPAAVFRMDM